MTPTLALADALDLLDDEEPAVRQVALVQARRWLCHDDADVLAGALWTVAGSFAYPLLPEVMALLGHDSAGVRALASTATRSLHPLAGLPSMTGAAEPPAAPAGPMARWLAPRPLFEAGLTRLLARPERARALEQLARLPGEQTLLGARVAALPADEATAYRQTVAALAAERTPVQLIIALTYRCNRKCPYCYAYESQDRHEGDIDLAAARRALDWAVAQGARLISFTGGEPTCHPRFVELAREVERRGLRLYLNSNGLFGTAVRDVLGEGFIANVGFHVSERKLHRPGELATIAENAAALVARGIHVFVRHTLWRGSSPDDIAWLLDYCAAAGIDTVNLALAFPGQTASNRYVPADDFAPVKPALLETLHAAARRGMTVRLSKPVPLCLFSPEEYASLQRQHEMMSLCTVHARGRVHNVVVNPDLTTYPCVGLPETGPRIDAAPDYRAVAAHAGAVVGRALRVVQRACDGCPMFTLGVCQASCLGHCHEPAAAASRTLAVAP